MPLDTLPPPPPGYEDMTAPDKLPPPPSGYEDAGSSVAPVAAKPLAPPPGYNAVNTSILSRPTQYPSVIPPSEAMNQPSVIKQYTTGQRIPGASKYPTGLAASNSGQSLSTEVRTPIEQFRMEFFNTDDPTRYSIPMQVAVGLAKNPKDAKLLAQLKRMQPISQQAIMQKADELSTEAETNRNTTIVPGQYSEAGTTPPVAMDKRTGQVVRTRPSEVIASLIRGPEGAKQLASKKGVLPALERLGYGSLDEENIGLLGMGGGLSSAVPALGKVISAGFAGMAGKQAIDKLQAGDPGGALVDALLAGLAGGHALKGAGESIKAVRNAGNIETPQLSEGLYAKKGKTPVADDVSQPRPKQLWEMTREEFGNQPNSFSHAQPKPEHIATREQEGLRLTDTLRKHLRPDNVTKIEDVPDSAWVLRGNDNPYGKNLAFFEGSGAKIAVEGTTEFRSLTKGLKRNAVRMQTAAPDIVSRAKAAGFDAVEFKGTNIGTIVINPEKFTSRRSIIEKAISEGKSIPPEVLADYPDLVKLSEQGTAVPERPQLKATGAAQTSPQSAVIDAATGKPRIRVKTPMPEIKEPVKGVAETTPATVAPEVAPEKAPGVTSGGEPVKRPVEHTGAANIITEAERAARNMPPVERQEYTKVRESYDLGRAAVEDKGADPRTLAQEVAAKPRPLDKTEVGTLAYDRARLISEHAKATKVIADAIDSKNERAQATQAVKLSQIEKDLDLNDQALVKGGREQSAAFAARKMLVAEDYSYAGMLQRAKATKEKPLSLSERGQIKTLNETIQSMSTAIEEHKQRIANLESERVIKRAVRQDVQGSRRQARASTRQNLDTEYADLKERFRKAGTKLNAGLDPETASLAVQIVHNRAKALGLKASDVIDHVYEELRGHVAGLTRNDIRDAVLQSRVEAQKARTAKSTEGYRELAESGTARPNTREKLPYDRDLEMLKMEQERAKRTYQAMVDNMKRGRVQRTVRGVVNVANAGRSVITSVDLSAPGRQGFFLSASNPLLAAKSVAPMLRAAVSEHAARAVDQEIHSRPNAPLYEDSKLYLSPVEHGGSLSKLEEAYATNLAEKIPGIGKLVRGSERAYVTFLNKLRADNFDSLHRQLERMGEKDTAKADTAIADFINKATGRGGLTEVGNRASTLLSTVFFSPRFVASRFQLLAGQPFYGGTLASRALIARSYVQYAGAVGTILYLSHLAGAEVSMDPQSADFLKLRFGNMVVDVHAGLQQVGRFLAQEYTGDKNRAETIGRFARSKTSPVAGTAVDLAYGKDYIGKPVTPPKKAIADLKGGRFKTSDVFESETGRNTIPMAARDIYEAASKEGSSKTAMTAILSVMGVGVSEYPKSGSTPRKSKPSAASMSFSGKSKPLMKSPKMRVKLL